MTEWYVKDLSKLTDVSVQTLHHYDRIELLKPSVRLANGYRVYSEKDLLKLQQIIALKFFGFELAQIKTLLADEREALEHFAVQAKFLEQKAHALLDASKALQSVISNVNDDKSIPWQTIIELIEVYRMTQQLEHAWVKDIFTPEELKEYAAFEAEFKTRFTPDGKTKIEKAWYALMDEIKQHLHQNPESETGMHLGGKCMTLVNEWYGKKYAHLRTKKFERGFGEGKGLDEVGMTPEIVVWLEKAINAYWRQRIHAVLAQVPTLPHEQALKKWNDLLDEICGEDSVHRQEVVTLVMSDDDFSGKVRESLQRLLK